MADENPWRPLNDQTPKDRMVEFYCPGISKPSKGILQGIWNDRLKIWTLNPYGTTQFVTLFPSMWREIGNPPT